MSTISIISLVTVCVLILTDVYYIGKRSGYREGFTDGKFKTMMYYVEKMAGKKEIPEKAEEKARNKFE